MKKITAFVGSPRKRHTHQCVSSFLERLHALGDVESEVITLSDLDVKRCRGCCFCFAKGEEFCPCHDDDRDVLMDKMMASDGVVFASPTYSFQVSAVMKTFLDRLGFVFHRPRFFGKTFTSIAVQGIYGGQDVVKYLDFVGQGLGFNVVKGSCVTTCEPITAENQRKIDRVLEAHSNRFHEGLSRSPYPRPTFVDLMRFRMARTSMRLMLDETARDYRYYRDNGWFESDFFYPVRLDPAKRVAGALFDFAAARSARRGVVGVRG
jgi:multimeric flavodoxin WrbA